MQTTLLGFAIAVILALVAALVGPRYVDWTQYRSEFETNASSLIGLRVRASGAIDLQLLPTPALTVTQFEVARPGGAGAVRVRKLSIEFELGALLRGEWRAANVRLEGADFAFGLDSMGRLDWPALVLGKEAERLSIQRLDIVDGRALVADATSGHQALVEKLEFTGELRSLMGPLKGEGSFSVGGEKYPYRIAVGRLGDDGTLRLRLNADPVDRPLAEADGTLWLDQGVPRFEGTLALVRPVRAAAAGGIVEPWRLTSKFKGDSTAALLEQVEFQYGPDDRAVKLRGDAKLMFGRKPQLAGVLSSTQIDLDRLLDLPEATRKRPMVALKNFADYFAGLQKPPIPVKLGVTVEQVTLAGALLQRVASDISSDGENWDVESLHLRAPGATQIGISGRLAVSRDGITFAGPAKIEARDARALTAWLTDRADVQVAAGPLRAEGEVAFGGGAFSVERLKAEFDRTNIDGRLAYGWPSGAKPARIEMALTTPDVDLDRALALVQNATAETSFEWPREGAVTLKLGRATLAGIEAKRADVKAQFDAKGLVIEEFTIGDFGGAALAASGRIDAHLSSPHGTVTLDLTARSLEGAVALIEKFSPTAAEQLRRGAARLVPAKLSAVLAINADASAPGAPPLATFTIEGSAGTTKISLQGDAGSAGDHTTIEQLADLVTGNVNLAGRVEAADGAALVELLALDRLVAVDKRPARFSFTTSGMISGDLAVEGQIVAGGLDAIARGSFRFAGHGRPTGGLDLRLTNGNLRLPRMLAGARLGEAAPAAFTARIALTENAIALTDVIGKLAGSDLKGRLNIALAPAPSVDGELELGQINLPATLGAAIGAPAPAANSAWAVEPFEAGVLGSLTGQVGIKAARVIITPKLTARDVRGVLHLGKSELALQKFEGALSGGRVTGDIVFEQSPEGLSTRGQVRVVAADIAELTPGDGRALTGRVTIEANLAGTGRSPVALVGALNGGGSFRWQEGRVLRLDPASFEAVTRGIDRGLPLDAERIRDRMELALANGALAVPLVEGELVVNNGQVRLINPAVRAERVGVNPTGSIDLAENSIDARLLLTGPELAGAPEGAPRPELTIVLKGPIDAPRRTLDATSFASWLALRAVEQQAKRVDVLEAGGELPASPTTPIAPAPYVPPVTASPAAPPSISAPRSVLRGVPDLPVVRPRATAPSPATTGSAPLDIRPTQR